MFHRGHGMGLAGSLISLKGQDSAGGKKRVSDDAKQQLSDDPVEYVFASVIIMRHGRENMLTPRGIRPPISAAHPEISI